MCPKILKMIVRKRCEGITVLMCHHHRVFVCLPLHIVWAVLFCSEPQTAYSTLLPCCIKRSKTFSIRPVALISPHVLRSHQEGSYLATILFHALFPCPTSRDMNCSWVGVSPHLTDKSRSPCSTMTNSSPLKFQANLADFMSFQFQIYIHGRPFGEWIIKIIL